MISCPAAKQIRCVKPSMATVSPSRTISLIATRIEVTLDELMRDLTASGLEDRQPRADLLFGDDKWRRDANGGVTRLEQEGAALEGGFLDPVGDFCRPELDADHESQAAHVGDEVVARLEGAQTLE